MEHIEETALLTFPHQVILWKRSVNDTFVVIDNNFVDEFHEHLNSIHPDIQFRKLNFQKLLPENEAI